jgi:hypothetical protein
MSENCKMWGDWDLNLGLEGEFSTTIPNTSCVVVVFMLNIIWAFDP